MRFPLSALPLSLHSGLKLIFKPERWRGASIGRSILIRNPGTAAFQNLLCGRPHWGAFGEDSIHDDIKVLKKIYKLFCNNSYMFKSFILLLK
jgi:hypothetical protein